jgi:hypothetical protein
MPATVIPRFAKRAARLGTFTGPSSSGAALQASEKKKKNKTNNSTS